MSNFEVAIQQTQQQLQSGQLGAAADSFCNATKVVSDPSQLPAVHQWTIALHQAGQLSAAVAGYECLLQQGYVSAAIHHNLGLAYHALGQFGKAAERFHDAHRLDTSDPASLVCLGNALRENGQLEQAVAAYRRAIAVQPSCFDAYLQMGIAYRQWKRFEKALECYRKANELQPGHAHLAFCAARAYQEMGDWEAAVESYQESLKRDPSSSACRNGLGNLLQSQGKLREAAEQYELVLRAFPQDVRALNNMGTVLRRMGRSREAIDFFRKAIALSPQLGTPYSNMGHALRDEGQFDVAVVSYQRSLQVDPDNLEALGSMLYLKQRLCQWDNLLEESQRLREACQALGDSQTGPHPLSIISLPIETTAEEQLHAARNWARQFSTSKQASFLKPSKGQATATARPIRVGYLSADFYDHPVAALIPEIFELHDRKRCTVFAYSIGAGDESDIRKRIVQGVDYFRDEYARSYSQTCQSIADDRIDILVDLMGYTKSSRTQILASKPAPIQVNYLGYPGTMGASYMDYIIVDPRTVPSDQQPHFSEQLVQLPVTYLPCDSQRPIATSEVTRQQFGIAEDAFVFCSFVNSYKITPCLFAIWMRLLKAIPKSLLWLSSHNRWVVENLTREARARGIEPERLVFSERLSIEDHLARHRLADLFLDTFPYNGHTTASDALRCGLPLVTCRGATFASRVAASLLEGLGLQSLITQSLQEYENLCLQLASQPRQLELAREQLIAALGSKKVFNSQYFTASLESAYEMMWRRACNGESPAPITFANS
ncbi:MAG: tetratricopeptide repeat protein [bacterium]|nr:tetratricopeptide repeat protein [bacterium]